jgi:hypothetical protein
VRNRTEINVLSRLRAPREPKDQVVGLVGKIWERTMAELLEQIAVEMRSSCLVGHPAKRVAKSDAVERILLEKVRQVCFPRTSKRVGPALRAHILTGILVRDGRDRLLERTLADQAVTCHVDLL